MLISQAFTLAANRREQSDSLIDEGAGETLTTINVFESPPKQGWLKFHHGTCSISNFFRHIYENVRFYIEIYIPEVDM